MIDKKNMTEYQLARERFKRSQEYDSLDRDEAQNDKDF